MYTEIFVKYFMPIPIKIDIYTFIQSGKHWLGIQVPLKSGYVCQNLRGSYYPKVSKKVQVGKGWLLTLSVQERETCGPGVATSSERPRKGDRWDRDGY